MKKQKGFTIIELIVVIAIIAVLAAIVLVNVTQYINRAKNVAIKADLESLITNSASYFADNPSGTGQTFSTSSQSITIAFAITNAGGMLNQYFSSTTQAWCACTREVPSSGNIAYCVDYNGTKEEINPGTCGCSFSTYTCP